MKNSLHANDTKNESVVQMATLERLPENAHLASEETGVLVPDEIETLLSTENDSPVETRCDAAFRTASDPQETSTEPVTANLMSDNPEQLACVLQQAEAAQTSSQQNLHDRLHGCASYSLPEFSQPSASNHLVTDDLVPDMSLEVKIELGRTQVDTTQVSQWHEGSLVQLDTLASDPVDIRVDGKLIARGEILVLQKNFCVRVVELYQNMVAGCSKTHTALGRTGV